MVIRPIDKKLNKEKLVRSLFFNKKINPRGLPIVKNYNIPSDWKKYHSLSSSITERKQIKKLPHPVFVSGYETNISIKHTRHGDIILESTRRNEHSSRELKEASAKTLEAVDPSETLHAVQSSVSIALQREINHRISILTPRILKKAGRPELKRHPERQYYDCDTRLSDLEAVGVIAAINVTIDQLAILEFMLPKLETGEEVMDYRSMEERFGSPPMMWGVNLKPPQDSLTLHLKMIQTQRIYLHHILARTECCLKNESSYRPLAGAVKDFWQMKEDEENMIKEGAIIAAHIKNKRTEIQLLHQNAEYETIRNVERMCRMEIMEVLRRGVRKTDLLLTRWERKWIGEGDALTNLVTQKKIDVGVVKYQVELAHRELAVKASEMEWWQKQKLERLVRTTAALTLQKWWRGLLYRRMVSHAFAAMREARQAFAAYESSAAKAGADKQRLKAQAKAARVRMRNLRRRQREQRQRLMLTQVLSALQTLMHESSQKKMRSADDGEQQQARKAMKAAKDKLDRVSYAARYKSRVPSILLSSRESDVMTASRASFASTKSRLLKMNSKISSDISQMDLLARSATAPLVGSPADVERRAKPSGRFLK